MYKLIAFAPCSLLQPNYVDCALRSLSSTTMYSKTITACIGRRFVCVPCTMQLQPDGQRRRCADPQQLINSKRSRRTHRLHIHKLYANIAAWVLPSGRWICCLHGHGWHVLVCGRACVSELHTSALGSDRVRTNSVRLGERHAALNRTPNTFPSSSQSSFEMPSRPSRPCADILTRI